MPRCEGRSTRFADTGEDLIRFDVLAHAEHMQAIGDPPDERLPGAPTTM